MCSVKSVGTLFTRNVSSNVSPSNRAFLTKLTISILGQRTAANSGKDLTCVWCRARWIVARPGGGAGGVKRSMGGYINLSNVANVSPVRDTSTCKRDHFSECTLRSHFFRLSRSKERREVLWMARLFGSCVMSALCESRTMVLHSTVIY